MAIEKKIINRITSIDWFSNCGNIIDIHSNYEIKFVDSWAEAKNYFSQTLWEDKTLEESNNLTTYLFNKYPNEYSKWNVIVKEAKQFIENEIVPKIMKIEVENALGDTFVDCVKWDILGAIMENEFIKCKGIPIFSLKLLEIYEDGNFPCGIEKNNDGEFLIVF